MVLCGCMRILPDALLSAPLATGPPTLAQPALLPLLVLLKTTSHLHVQQLHSPHSMHTSCCVVRSCGRACVRVWCACGVRYELAIVCLCLCVCVLAVVWVRFVCLLSCCGCVLAVVWVWLCACHRVVVGCVFAWLWVVCLPSLFVVVACRPGAAVATRGLSKRHQAGAAAARNVVRAAPVGGPGAQETLQRIAGNCLTRGGWKQGGGSGDTLTTVLPLLAVVASLSLFVCLSVSLSRCLSCVRLLLTLSLR